MFKRIAREWRKRRLHQAASGIRSTPPLDMREGPLVVFSMLCRRDIDTWLVAVKSLYRRLGRGGISILDDGSLGEADIALLRRHIPGLEYRHIADVDTTDLPTGGCWERLITLIELSQDRYAIQLDADIVALGAIPEVLDCIDRQASFALGNYLRPGLVSLADAAAYTAASSWGTSTHVQTMAEQAFARLPYCEQRRYIRASASFTGVPPGVCERATIVGFSNDMQAVLADKWLEWGSEQVTSNYLIANLPGACELPSPKYANAMPHLDLDQSVLLHFFGSVRYDSGRYADACRAVIGECHTATPIRHGGHLDQPGA